MHHSRSFDRVSPGTSSSQAFPVRQEGVGDSTLRISLPSPTSPRRMPSLFVICDAYLPCLSVHKKADRLTLVRHHPFSKALLRPLCFFLWKKITNKLYDACEVFQHRYLDRVRQLCRRSWWPDTEHLYPYRRNE